MRASRTPEHDLIRVVTGDMRALLAEACLDQASVRDAAADVAFAAVTPRRT